MKKRKWGISIMLVMLVVVFFCSILGGCSSNINNTEENVSTASEEEKNPFTEQLYAGTWYANTGHKSTAHRLTFTKEYAFVETFHALDSSDAGYMGDGEQCSYTIDGAKIDILREDGAHMVIPYIMDGETLDLGPGEWFTPEEILDGLQGYWRYSETKLNKGLVISNTKGNVVCDYDFIIDGDEISYEFNEMSIYEMTDAGPYYGTITIVPDTSIEDMMTEDYTYNLNDTPLSLYFNILDGEITLYYGITPCTRIK